MSARQEILARIDTALGHRPAKAGLSPVPRSYRTSLPDDPETLLERLIDRLVDYRATVFRALPGDPDAAIAEALARAVAGRDRLIVPAGVPQAWLAGLEAELLSDEPALSVAVAETGTIVLDASAGQGRRAVTLVPDFHVVVVRRTQVVGLVGEALTRLDPSRPLTWISGPSATSDIELSRVEGVHGPRTLHVVIA